MCIVNTDLMTMCGLEILFEFVYLLRYQAWGLYQRTAGHVA